MANLQAYNGFRRLWKQLAGPAAEPLRPQAASREYKECNRQIQNGTVRTVEEYIRLRIAARQAAEGGSEHERIPAYRPASEPPSPPAAPAWKPAGRAQAGAGQSPARPASPPARAARRPASADHERRTVHQRAPAAPAERPKSARPAPKRTAAASGQAVAAAAAGSGLVAAGAGLVAAGAGQAAAGSGHARAAEAPVPRAAGLVQAAVPAGHVPTAGGAGPVPAAAGSGHARAAADLVPVAPRPEQRIPPEFPAPVFTVRNNDLFRRDVKFERIFRGKKEVKGEIRNGISKKQKENAALLWGMDLYTRLPVRELERHSATHPDHIIECQVGVLTWGSSLAAVKGTTKSFELRRDPDYKTLQDAVKEVWNHMRNLNVTTEGINKSKQGPFRAFCNRLYGDTDKLTLVECFSNWAYEQSAPKARMFHIFDQTMDWLYHAYGQLSSPNRLGDDVLPELQATLACVHDAMGLDDVVLDWH